jgi:hypothetical protein
MNWDYLLAHLLTTGTVVNEISDMLSLELPKNTDHI